MLGHLVYTWSNIIMAKQDDEKVDGPSTIVVRQSDDEIRLIDIFNFLKEGRVLIFATTFVGFFGGIGYGYYLPAMYKATAYIQVAQVANIAIETPESLIEKLKLPLYFSEATINACDIGRLNDPFEYLSKNLKPVITPNNAFIKISYETDSTKSAVQCLTGVVDLIGLRQSALIKDSIDYQNNYANTLKLQLENLKTLRKKLELRYLYLNNVTDISASQLLYAVMIAKDIEARDIEKKLFDLQLAMHESQTHTARLVAPVYASEHKISPNRKLIAGIATLAGLFLGISLLLLRAGMKVRIGANGHPQE